MSSGGHSMQASWAARASRPSCGSAAPASPSSSGSCFSALRARTDGAQHAGRRRGLASKLYRQRLELVDEVRFGVDRLPRKLDPGIARQGFFEHQLELKPGKRRAKAEVPSARPKRLVLGITGDVEAVGILIAGLVAVRGHVPHHDLLAPSDFLPTDVGVTGGGAPEVRKGGKHA